MQLPNRTLECHLNRKTLDDLIVTHLISMGVIRYHEEVTDLTIKQTKDGLLKLTVRFEPDIQVI